MNQLRDWWRSLSDAMRLRILIIPVLLVGAVVPTAWGLVQTPDWPGLALNFGTGMGSTLITFMLIDMLIGSREKREANERERARLIGRMHSRDNGLTLVAIEEMRAHGWLIDGTLRGANLVHANLQAGYLRYAILPEVNLHQANLQKTRLGKADLSGANLTDANLEGTDLDQSKLQGARVSLEQLAQANRLRGASMPGGERYDGRFNLLGDLHDAEEAGTSLSDPADMAAFYGISLEEYLAGQQWAQEHLPAMRSLEPAAARGTGKLSRKQPV